LRIGQDKTWNNPESLWLNCEFLDGRIHLLEDQKIDYHLNAEEDHAKQNVKKIGEKIEHREWKAESKLKEKRNQLSFEENKRIQKYHKHLWKEHMAANGGKEIVKGVGKGDHTKNQLLTW